MGFDHGAPHPVLGHTSVRGLAYIAVKAFALAVLEKMTKQYPELIPEIKLIVSQQMEIETAAYKSRAKRILRLKDPV